MFSLDVYQTRRDRLKAQLPDGAMAVIAAAEEVIRNRDAEYPFRQSSDFLYLTGFNEPDAVLVIRPNAPERLFVRPRDPDREVWTGRRLGPERVQKSLGIAEASPLDALPTDMQAMLDETTWLEYPFDCKVTSALIEKCLADRKSHGRRQELLSHRVDLSRRLHQARMIKGPEEIQAMQTAGRISAAGHVDAMRMCRPGLTEDQLASVVEHRFRMEGSPSVAYQTIVGGGENACILHYIDRQDPLHDGDLVLIDAGCEIEGYAGDITRTFPVNGRFSGPQAEIYDLVLQAQADALAEMCVGRSIRLYHQTAVRTLTEGLIALGFIQGPLEDALEEKRFHPFYMHGTGHLLGLDVHDVGRYENDGEPVLLEDGMVLTCEPGLYLSQRLSIPEQFQGIGVRIEDDILITADGPQVLTGDVPKSRDEIEALMRDGACAVS